MMFVEEVTKWNRTYHHLNKNTEDNRPANLVFAHEECNTLCENNYDWQLLSKQKLIDNEKYHEYAEDPEVTAHNDEDKETNVEIDTNELYLKFTKEILTDKLKEGKAGKPAVEISLNFRDTANDVAYKVKEIVAHGSSITASRAIDLECASVSDFEKYKEQGGKWRIRKRKK